MGDLVAGVLAANAAEFDDVTAARFWSKVDKRGPNECWEWTGAKYTRGYGQFYLLGKSRRAGQVSLMLSGEVKPFDAAMALHTCDNPPCCNPAHLRWGTSQDNAADRERRGRGAKNCFANRRVEICPRGHALSGDNLRVSPKGWRRCLACKKIHNDSRYKKNRAAYAIHVAARALSTQGTTDKGDAS